MVKLAKEKGESVQAIALNLDLEGEETSAGPDQKTLVKIQRVLDKFEIRVENHVSTTGIDAVLESLGASAGLPTVVVYDKEGKVAKLFDGMFSYDDDITPLVDDLIAAQAK